MHNWIRRFALFVIVLAVFGGLLWLDLRQQGLAWRTFWALTGEETPAGQLRGLVEWLGNLTRAQPQTQALIPIDHAGVNPFGINTFWEQEVEIAKREQQAQMIAEAGFAWIRQQFPWEDIEIAGRGDFIDRRNDLDGDGQVDAIEAWVKYDNIVAIAEAHGLRIQARLDNPPAWSHADPASGAFAPPDDLQDFVNYATAVAERYRGRIHHYQVWNEPNIYPEWGEQAVNPDAYTALLCRTYTALKAVDPEIVVISGALAPTIALNWRDLNDFIFLERMYAAGAGACFDVLAVQGYGLNSGPTDQRMRPTTVNFARHRYIRELMVAHGDGDKPIWISEAAWNPVDAPEVPADVVGRANFGMVTPEQAARYMPLAYERVQQEWPWIGVMNYWFFKRAADFERGQAFYYFRMVEPDFTPLPIYAAMRDYIHGLTPTLYAGVHQEDHWALTTGAGAAPMADPAAQFGQAVETRELVFTAHGTDVAVRWRGAHALHVEIDGRDGGTLLPLSGWNRTSIYRALSADTVTIRLSASEPIQIDSLTVSDRTMLNLLPLLSVGVSLGLFSVWVILSALRARR